jgi:hypothetical protein
MIANDPMNQNPNDFSVIRCSQPCMLALVASLLLTNAACRNNGWDVEKLREDVAGLCSRAHG